MDEEDKQPQEAAQEAADADRLLQGEPADTVYEDDARLWIQVYLELIEYKRRLLSTTQETLATMPEGPARREVAETDLVILQSEVSRFTRRLEFWKRRLSESLGQPEP
ncbi:MAG: hypothetical protein J2P45_15075 [Candidatus Dormibacteraeota bacterium]|nr:hypothetical protein [Candidatus Dormibacteraeota bacterium]